MKSHLLLAKKQPIWIAGVSSFLDSLILNTVYILIYNRHVSIYFQIPLVIIDIVFMF